MKEIEVSAKTVELAIEQGLKELGVSQDDVEIDVLSTGGLFTKAKVRLACRESVSEKGKAFLEGVLRRLKIGAFVEAFESDEEAKFEIIGNDVSELTSGNGELFDALEYLVGLAANKNMSAYKRVIIDSENFRAERLKKLEEYATAQAQRAVNTSRRIKLYPMNPFQRRIIHSKLQSFEGVTTSSEGVDPYRYVVITPLNRQKNNNRFGSNNFGRKGGRDNNKFRHGNGNGMQKRGGNYNANKYGESAEGTANRTSSVSMRSSGFSTGMLIKRNQFEKEE